MSAISTLLVFMANGIIPSVLAESNDIEMKLLRVTESRFVDVNEPSKKNGDSSQFFATFAPENVLTLTIEMEGQSLANATHYGKVTMDAKDNHGQAIKLHHSYKSGLTDLRSEMAQIDREMMFFAQPDPPDDVLRIELKCAMPSRKAEFLSVPSGTMNIRTGQPKEVIIPDVMKLLGKKVKHPSVVQAGIQIVVNDPKDGGNMFFSGEPGKALTLTFSGELDSLLAIDLIDGKGDEVDNSKMWSAEGSSTQYTLMTNETIPDDAQLKITVTTESRVIEVPFSFKKIELP